MTLFYSTSRVEENLSYFDFGKGLSESVYIQANLHSHELNSLLMLLELKNLLEIRSPKKQVRLVLNSNPIGLSEHFLGSSGRRSFVNSLDWNRIFTPSILQSDNMESRIANKILNLSEGFDYILDVHTPDCGFEHIYCDQTEWEFGELNSVPRVISDEQTVGAFEDYCRMFRKQRSFTIELPSISIFVLSQAKFWAEKVFSLIENIRPVEKNFGKNNKIFKGKMTNLYTSHDAIFLRKVDGVKKLNAGHDIGELIFENGARQELTADRECIPLCFRRRGVVNSGSWVCRVLEL